MAESLSSTTRAEFARWVQDALNRLYDSPYLLTHPLAEALVGSTPAGPQRGSQLRKVLLDAIHTMGPEPQAPVQTADWRAYRILVMRYIEGLSPPEVMQRLALSRSYYFREQARLLDVLTTMLWDRWQFARRDAESPPAESAPSEGATREQLAYAESARLSAHATWEAVDAVQLLEQLHPIVDSLAREQGVPVQFDLTQRLTILHADRVLLRQALLNIISYALDIVHDGQMTISSFSAERMTGIRVLGQIPATTAPPGDTPQRQGVGLDVCRRFTEAMGGTLEVRTEATGRWEARLIWPLTTPHILLVIDDNQDFTDLFRRYLADHHWQVIGAEDGAEARKILAEFLPTVILLDVMMPREDGWDILAALRADERTDKLPIIICSVLNEPRLAHAFGANAYLPKPVTQQALLHALAPWNQVGASPAPAR